ncbi:MAG: hypothetical protein ACLFP2_02135 [Candidatus Woesearchaeota archaeon]
MECVRCNRKDAYEIVNGPLCRNCFLYQMEKRVKKHMDPIRPDDVISCGPLTRAFLDKILKFPVSYGESGKVILDRTLDDEAYAFLERLFRGEKLMVEKPTSIVRVLLDEEASLYAKLRGVEFPERERDPDMKAFLEGMQESYKETKFALLKSIDIL